LIAFKAYRRKVETGFADKDTQNQKIKAVKRFNLKAHCFNQTTRISSISV